MIRRRAPVLCWLMALALLGAIGGTTLGGHVHDHDHHDHAGDHDHVHQIVSQIGGAPAGEPSGHEHDEGLVLRPTVEETVAGDGRCLNGVPTRDYDVVALAVDITLNRYGDHDPEGRMYALSTDVEAVQAAENGRANAVSPGLQGDAIQPLVLRVLPGECLRITLTNQLEGEPASIHVHGSSLVLASDGSAAIAANSNALAEPGSSVAYEWMVSESEPEGTHVFHSHGNARSQSGHGLFGAVVVEPPGSEWRDPRTGATTSQWDAVVVPEEGEAFREFVIFYHEVGDENYLVLDDENHPLPLVDPTTSAYRPGARALNYRSEPFMNRLELAQAEAGIVDESLAYSSYSFGDPATPIQRTYIGDPVKERVVHAGPEVFHVHHVHGGSVRWRRQPGAGPPEAEHGLEKHPSLLPGPSERTDSQTLGPSETFDVEHECSAGGCQQGAGDYLVHCHVAHHYFAGMWGIWRVYNTLQDGVSSTDSLEPLPSLPDRPDAVAPAVTSDLLTVAALARAQNSLPPAGVPKGYDASVFDWTEENDRILNQPETLAAWPGYDSPTPGVRPPILFERSTGRPAYPMLRPQLGARPPFAPGHGPAAFIDRPRADGLPAPPGADGPESLCPAGTTVRSFALRATELPVPINKRLGIVDPSGVIFVLAEDEAAVLADPERRAPLAIRANAGQDCVDITLTNAVPDNGDHPFSKISAHIHFMQFDVQSSDGVNTGFNFEQTLRPFEEEGERLVSAVQPGDTSVPLGNADRFSVGAFVGIGMEDSEGFEIRRIVEIDPAGSITVDRPLDRGHEVDAIVSAEFLRQRWYPDAQVGTAYFHDHVNGIRTWQRGLVGAVVVEPPGATYHDPVTGEEVSSGALVDVRLDDNVPVSADISGSFREFVTFIQDPSRLNNADRSPGANLNLRAEPLDRRDGPVEQILSSVVHGDPATPLVRAYVGDPLVVRATVGGTNEIHTLHLDGHWFREEPWSADSQPINTTHIGISERKDLSVPAAGGPQRRPGDYLYLDGRALKLREGAWGLLRVFGAQEAGGPLPLPGHNPPTGPAPPICPDGAPVRSYEVAAVQAKLPMLDSGPGQVFVEASLVEAVQSGTVAPTPLVLRAAVGDCVEVNLQNLLPEGSLPVSLHADRLAYDPRESGGIEVGMQPAQSVAVGSSRTYTFYAHPEYGVGAAMLRDGADVAHSGARGLYGAVVVAPAGSTFDDSSAWSTVVRDADGRAWRDAVLFMHDTDDAIGSHRMPYTTAVRGAVGMNYGRAATGPVIEAFVGDPLQIHVLAPWSEQVQVFSIEGHRWPIDAAMNGSTKVASIAIGGLESIVVTPEGGAGGELQLAGTYDFGDHREPYREAGLSGTLVVHDRSTSVDGIEPLSAVAPGTATPQPTDAAIDESTPNRMAFVLGLAVLAGTLAISASFVRRSRVHESSKSS